MFKKIDKKNLRILITGSSGLVGSEITKLFLKKRIKIFIPKKNELNLLNFTKVQKYLKKNKINFIIHAAARVGGIGDNITNRIDYLSNNTLINYNIIMASYKSKIKYFLNLGSSCMYPSNQSGFLKENMIDYGMFEKTNEGHAISKYFSLKLCNYIKNDNENYYYKTLIPCNIYGDNDNFNLESSHFIPAIINKVANAKKNKLKKITVWGDGKSKREILHVTDLAEGIYFCFKNFEKMPDILNIGTGNDLTITKYYKIVSRIAKYKGALIYDKNKPNGMRRKVLSVKKIHNFGWHHRINIEKGLSNTFKNFFLNYL